MKFLYALVALATTTKALEPVCKNSLSVGGRSDYLLDNVFDVQYSPQPAGIIKEDDVVIPMRDGVKLSAVVYRPANNKPAPAISSVTIYGKTDTDPWFKFAAPPNGLLNAFYMGTLHLHNGTSFEAWDPGYWVAQGYVVVIVDDPGTGDSGSNLLFPPPTEERMYDVVDWISKQWWCTGSVGMGGVSWLAVRSYSAAVSAHPALKAIIPWEGFNQGGPGRGSGGISDLFFAYWIPQLIEGGPPEMDPAGVGNVTIDNINVPTLVCASFSDQELHTFGSFEVFMRAKTPKEDLYLFNHRHQKWATYYDQQDLQKKFFDKYLKGDKTAMTGVPRVRLEISETRNKSKIIESTDWPVPGTTYRSLNLDTCTLTLTPNNITEEGPTLKFSPLPEHEQNNRAAFDYVFDQDTDVVGHMALRLWVEAIDLDDSDLFIGIEKLDANGEQVFFFSSSGGNANGPVTRGFMRVSARELDPELSVEWKPVQKLPPTTKKLSPGEVVPVDVMIYPSGTTFRRGETLRLTVASWSAYDQGGEPRIWDNYKTGSTRIYSGGKYDSRLLIPVIPS